jgi:hypothetical protein
VDRPREHHGTRFSQPVLPAVDNGVKFEERPPVRPYSPSSGCTGERRNARCRTDETRWRESKYREADDGMRGLPSVHTLRSDQNVARDADHLVALGAQVRDADLPPVPPRDGQASPVALAGVCQGLVVDRSQPNPPVPLRCARWTTFPRTRSPSQREHSPGVLKPDSGVLTVQVQHYGSVTAPAYAPTPFHGRRPPVSVVVTVTVAFRRSD